MAGQIPGREGGDQPLRGHRHLRLDHLRHRDVADAPAQHLHPRPDGAPGPPWPGGSHRTAQGQTAESAGVHRVRPRVPLVYPAATTGDGPGRTGDSRDRIGAVPRGDRSYGRRHLPTTDHRQAEGRHGAPRRSDRDHHRLRPGPGPGARPGLRRRGCAGRRQRPRHRSRRLRRRPVGGAGRGRRDHRGRRRRRRQRRRRRHLGRCGAAGARVCRRASAASTCSSRWRATCATGSW